MNVIKPNIAASAAVAWLVAAFRGADPCFHNELNDATADLHRKEDLNPRALTCTHRK